MTLSDPTGGSRAFLGFTSDSVAAGDSFARSPDLVGTFGSHSSATGGALAASPVDQAFYLIQEAGAAAP